MRDTEVNVSRRKIFITACVFVATLCGIIFPLSAAESPATTRAGDQFSGEILIGATFPLTGVFDYYGQSAYYGANTCANVINAAGGINGKRLVIKWMDNASDSKKAIVDAKQLVAEGCIAILGPLLSDSAVAMRNTIKEMAIVFISPYASSNSITKDNPWMFRSCFNNSVQAESMIKFQMQSFGAASCAILYDPRHEFSSELATIFKDAFIEAGGKVTGTLAMGGGIDKMDYATPLKKLAADNPDFIYVPSYGLEASELIHAARDLGIPTRFAGPFTWDNELVFNAAGRRLSGTAISSSLFEKNYNYRPFQIFYRSMEAAGMDYPDAMAASAWDAVMLMVEGLKNGETPEKMREGILSVKQMPLATGVSTVLPDHNILKPVIIRLVEQRGGRMLPIYAERYDPE